MSDKPVEGAHESSPFAEPVFAAERGDGLEEDEGVLAEEGGAGEERAGNAVAGGTAKSVLEHVARSIVDEPDAVEVEVGESRGALRLALHVAPDDMGRIIGRRGRVAQAVRTLVRAAATRDGTDASVDIVD